MIGFNVPGKLSRRILMLTAGIFLIAATEGALLGAAVPAVE
jgi:hypothetical protein